MNKILRKTAGEDLLEHEIEKYNRGRLLGTRHRGRQQGKRYGNETLRKATDEDPVNRTLRNTTVADLFLIKSPLTNSMSNSPLCSSTTSEQQHAIVIASSMVR